MNSISNIFKYLWNIIAVLIAKLFLVPYSKWAIESDRTALFLIPWLTYGGAETVNLEILEALKKDGWQIVIITTKANRHEWKDRFLEYASTIIHIESLPLKLQPYIILETVKKFNINVAFISNSVSGYMAAPHIHKYCNVIDLTHSEGGVNDQGGSPAFAAMYDSYLDRRIVISDRLKQLYLDTYNINPDKITVIRNGVNIEQIIDSIKKVQLDTTTQDFVNRERIVTWAGRLSAEKQPHIVLDLAKILPGYNFVLIGDGELYNEIMAKAQGMTNVLLTGAFENVKVKKVLSLSDVVILTSQFEGVPMILLEAMSLGKPVVTVNVGAVGEIVENTEDGYIIDNSNMFDGMSELIEEAYKNKNSIKEKAIEKVRTKFNKNDMQNSYKTVFNELIS